MYHADRAAPGALVVLAPVKGSEADSRVFQTESDGSFEYKAVRPGEYVLFAMEPGSDLEYANPAAIRPYLEAGTPIRVEPEGSYTVRLEL